MSTAECVARLRAAGVDTSWRDLRDCLWLATLLATERPLGAHADEDDLGGPPGPVEDAGPVLSNRYPLVAPDIAGTAATGIPTAEQPPPVNPLEVYAPPHRRDTGDAVPGIAVRLANTLPALPDSALIGRNLRPLKRHVPLYGALVVDEDATVEHISQTRLWSPVLTPRLGRWLDLHLVLDGTSSMVIWEPMCRALAAVLGRTAAFRRIRTWRLDADRHNGRAVLYSIGRAATEHDPREAIDPTGRSVVLLVSDGVAPGWNSGAVDVALAAWAAAGPVALWQPLPPRLWRRTSMRAQRALVAANRPGQPAAGYRVTCTPLVPPQPGSPLVGVPILSGRDGSPAAWARLIAAGGSAELAVRVLRGGGDAAPPSGGSAPDGMDTPEEIIRAFRSHSSATAMRLAVYLSAIPLTLDTMRMAQQVMLPESGSSHLAEVFLGGLLQEVPAAPGSGDRQYDFVPGVREALLSAITRGEALDVLSRVADHGALPLTQAGGFGAVLADPLGAGVEVLRASDRPFAKVARTVLSRLGGDHAELAGRVTGDGLILVPDKARDAHAPQVQDIVVPPPRDRDPGRDNAPTRRAAPGRGSIVGRLSRPMLFVGLGGTGCRVGIDVEQQLRAAFCGPDGTRLQRMMHGRDYLPYQLPSCVQFVYADLSARELTRVLQEVVPGPEHDAAARRTMRITTDLVPVRLSTSSEVSQSLRLQLDEDTISWLPGRDSEPRVGPLHMGAGQLPTVGRAVLFESMRGFADTVLRDIQGAVKDITTSASDLQIVNGGWGTRVSPVDVFVAFSVAGGTGAGLFYDYLHLIGYSFGRAGLSCQIHPLVLLPSAFPDGMGGGRASLLNAGSALIDLFRLVDDQNVQSGAESLDLFRHDTGFSIRYPPPVDWISLRAGTVQTAFLFGRTGRMAREGIQRSMSSLVQVLIGSDVGEPAVNQSFADDFINRRVERFAPAADGIGRRGVSTAAVATLGIPLRELVETMKNRFLDTAVQQLATPPDVGEQNSDLIVRFLDASGLNPLRLAWPVPIREATQVPVGYNSVLEALANRGRMMTANIDALPDQLRRPLVKLTENFNPVTAAEVLLRDGVDLMRLERVIFGRRDAADEVDRVGFAGVLDGYRYPPPAPSGLDFASPPAPTGLTRRALSRLRWSDPTVHAVIRRQDEWYAWRTRQVWNATWGDCDRLWDRVWREFCDEFRATLHELRSHAATDVQQFEQSSRALQLAAAGSSCLLPLEDGGVEGLYHAVLAGFDHHFHHRLTPGAREAKILNAVLEPDTWATAYRRGREYGPHAAVAVVERAVREAVTTQLLGAGRGRRPIVPRMTDLLAAAAGLGAREVPEAEILRFRQKLAGLVPSGFAPPGLEPLRAMITYPAADRDQLLETFLVRELGLSSDRLGATEFDISSSDSLVVVLISTGMAITDVPEAREAIRTWQDGIREGREHDAIPWRRRLAPESGYAVLARPDRERILHRLLCAAWNGQVDVAGNPESPDHVTIRVGADSAVTMRLELAPFINLSSWASLLQAYERWILSDDSAARHHLAACLMETAPAGDPVFPRPPAPLFIQVMSMAQGELAKVAQAIGSGLVTDHRQIRTFEDFWASDLRGALSRTVDGTQWSLATLAEAIASIDSGKT